MALASIILCAGKSTRMKSEYSKMLHSICGKPLCFWPVNKAVSLGSQPTIIVVGHQAKEVEAVLVKNFKNLTFALQSEQKGTGHAVQIAVEALGKFSGTVLVLCGDTPMLNQASLEKLCHLQKSKKAALALVTTTLKNPTGYGRILRDDYGHIIDVIEESEATLKQKKIQEINAGIYAFDAGFLKNRIHDLKPSRIKNEFYLTDLIAKAAETNHVLSISVLENEALGINDRIQLAYAEKILQKEINQNWMSKGVTLIDPDTTYISDEAKLGEDVTLEPGVHLRGKCEIAKGVHISAGSILTDTIVEENARIHPYSICEQAFIGKNSEIGPFVRLRPGAHLENSVKIGNFVEVKKSKFKSGSKANHLAYIGDTEVGEKTNIGAGTITCNYDGFKKHKTNLGKNVFIGSNSTLVAPLVVEDDAYVAAGSTLTKDVPKDALAIGRSRQENKKDYAKKIKKKFFDR